MAAYTLQDMCINCKLLEDYKAAHAGNKLHNMFCIRCVLCYTDIIRELCSIGEQINLMYFYKQGVDEFNGDVFLDTFLQKRLDYVRSLINCIDNPGKCVLYKIPYSGNVSVD